MKKSVLLATVLLLLNHLSSEAQVINTDSTRILSGSFLRLYPLELLVHEVRLGVELPTAVRQSVVIDASYFWGYGSADPAFNHLPGWAIKADYRFYRQTTNQPVRLFLGPNLMVKHQSIPNDFANSVIASSATDSRTVLCFNLKSGADFQLARNGHTRLEVFSGFGLRYQSITGNFNLDLQNRSTFSEGKVVPNLLFGLVLKL